jgi:uncharacterized protein (DUF362 family)
LQDMVRTTRREFLKGAAVAGAAIAGLPGTLEAAEKALGQGGKARVVIAKDTSVMASGGEVSASALDSMLSGCVKKLTGESEAVGAWKKLFKPDDIVGIKVNCLFGKGVSTRPEVANAIARGLMSAGVKAENIIIWDRSTGDLIKCGFTPNKSGKGVQVVADDSDWGETIEQGAFKGRITRIISERVTAFVNAPILKTHSISGISCCLKNHYGSFDNPSSHHKDNCNPAMADFSSIPMVKDKARLVVVDAIRPQYDGGPGLSADVQFDNYSMLVSRDPAAADAVGLDIIQKKRQQVGLEAFPAKKIAWLASAQERGVGVSDLDKIEIVNA